MKVSTLAIILLLGMGICIIAAMGLGAPDGAAGGSHPTVGSMSIGGAGENKHAQVYGVAWAFGVCMVLLFSTCLALGASKAGKVGAIGKYLFVGSLLHVAAFSAMMLAYRSYMVEGSAEFVGSLPLPSAIMMYVLWWTPAYFVAVYYFGFDRFIFSAEDEEKFSALVEARRAREGGDSN